MQLPLLSPDKCSGETNPQKKNLVTMKFCFETVLKAP